MLLIEENVHVDNSNGTAGYEYTDFAGTIEVETGFCNETTFVVKEKRKKKANHRLI
jgi:hypothetical protein